MVATATVTLSACALTPDYERPELDVPADYVETDPAGESIANMGWWDLFQDEQLELLVKTALEENKDRAVALSRILAARENVTFVRANQFPFFDLSGSLGRGQRSRELFPGADTDNRYSVFGDAAFQVDLWGQLSRATEAARADLLATEAAYRNVTITLVSDVAGFYLLLRDLDERLNIAERTLETRLDSLKIIQARFDKGTVPELDVNQAEIEVAVAETAIANFQRQIVQTENALRILLGRNPGPVDRGDALVDQVFPQVVPAGLPSELLQNRPDVVQAEARLVADTALIGVAEALRYPSIFLTGSLGFESTDLSDLNSSDARSWDIGANIFAPIFNSGQLKAQAEAAREQAEQSLLVYEQTLQQAFREVEDALVAIRTYKEEHRAQTRRVIAARNAARLSRARYDGGIVDYLEVLDTERTKFEAELAQSQTLQFYFNSIVQLYKALGGGWSVE
jgi:multidrug efflux system outer membrane protein